MKFELLFDFDVLSDLSLVVLELLLVLLWRQVDRLEGGSEFRGCSVVAESLMSKTLGIRGLLIVVQLHGHQDLDLCFDVVKDGQTV